MKENKRKSMIKVRGGFSDTTGIDPSNTQMQYEDFDDKTRVFISNMIFEILEDYFEGSSSTHYKDNSYRATPSNDFCKAMLSDVFGEKNRLNQGYSYRWRDVFKQYVDEVIDKSEYNEVLDIVWYICNWIFDNYRWHNDIPQQVINALFEREYVGYRFVDGRIVAITDENEIDEIEKACNSEIEGCRSHIHKAVGFLSDRENKDYKNCIKESISAVESICQIIIEDSKATLGDALKKLEDCGTKLHPALKQGFLKIYGYTSDEGGVRHAEGMFVSDVTFEEAKFMIVSCSAFVNYLMSEYGKMKLTKKK